MTEEELLQQPEGAYVSDPQWAFFHERLLNQRRELQGRIDEAFNRLRKYESSIDPVDAGSTEEQRQAHLRLLEREKKLKRITNEVVKEYKRQSAKQTEHQKWVKEEIIEIEQVSLEKRAEMH